LSIEALNEYLELVPKIINVTLKLAVAVGAIAILVYCGTIGYYPYGIQIGDGLFFIWIAVCFGFTYSLITFFLFCTGIAFLPVLKPLRWAAMKVVAAWRRFTRKPSTTTPPKIATITSDYAPLALIGVIGLVLIILAAVNDPKMALALLASAVIMGLGYSALLDLPRTHGAELDTQVAEPGKSRVRRVQLILVIAIYFIPLLVGGVLGNVLAQSFRLAGIRHESVTLYVDKDFFEVMGPAYNGGKDVETVGGFKRMKGVDVLFTGLGSSSLIRVPAGHGGRKFIVPNDKFHIEF
jgi:hypothetical protein